MAKQKELFVNVYEFEGELECGSIMHETYNQAYERRGNVRAYRYTAKLTPIAPEKVFVPKHGDICTVLTKQGLATKCKVYEHEGELYAIALKDDKPDGTFNPSQIEKFLPL